MTSYLKADLKLKKVKPNESGANGCCKKTRRSEPLLQTQKTRLMSKHKERMGGKKGKIEEIGRGHQTDPLSCDPGPQAPCFSVRGSGPQVQSGQPSPLAKVHLYAPSKSVLVLGPWMAGWHRPLEVGAFTGARGGPGQWRSSTSRFSLLDLRRC